MGKCAVKNPAGPNIERDQARLFPLYNSRKQDAKHRLEKTCAEDMASSSPLTSTRYVIQILSWRLTAAHRTDNNAIITKNMNTSLKQRKYILMFIASFDELDSDQITTKSVAGLCHCDIVCGGSHIFCLGGANSVAFWSQAELAACLCCSPFCHLRLPYHCNVRLSGKACTLFLSRY